MDIRESSMYIVKVYIFDQPTNHLDLELAKGTHDKQSVLALTHALLVDCYRGNYRPNFLIFDEPTNHLDLETVEALAKSFVGVT